ncbi:MAG TPA: HAMP domain-containing sensor histidine kinase [Verrucomicrobiae bacterium]|nr:HAMP domain-containing sensor histidine kinase [Verrucomicrobiae bacterium]
MVNKEEKIKIDTELEKTETIYGFDNIVKLAIKDFSKVNKNLDICADSLGSTFFNNTRLSKEFIILKEKGVKLRYITEITKDNIEISKKFINLMDCRHLDGIKINFGISDGKKYACTSHIKEEGCLPIELVYSTASTFVKQQQFLYEILWEKSMPAEQKIKEIEEGKRSDVWTRIIEDPEEIIKELTTLNNNAEYLSICTTAGGLEMSFNNLRDTYKKALNPNGKGFRALLTINKDCIYLVTKLIDLGTQIKHIKNILPISFGVSQNEVAITVEKMDGGKRSRKFLISNEPLYVDHFNTIFEDLWNKGVDAKRRIKNIEEGFEMEDVEIIPNAMGSIERAINMIKSAKNEIILLFPSYSGLSRLVKIDVMDILRKISESNKLDIKILVPFEKNNFNLLKELQSKFPFINIKSIDEKFQTQIMVLATDRKESIVWEIKDNESDTNVELSIESIGIAAYTNIKAISISYAIIFDNLWMQADMYEELKRHDKMQQEFINITAHELRTPIQPIIGILTILKSQLKSNSSVLYSNDPLELIDIAQRNAKRLMHLIEDVLDVTKIEGNILKMKMESINLSEIISEVIYNFVNGIEKKENKKNEFQCEYRSYKVMKDGIKESKLLCQYTASINEGSSQNPNVIIKADKSKLTQVLLNIIDNAYKFTTEGKIFIIVNIIDMHFDHNDQIKIIVSIRDTGIGINPDILPRLFTKFASSSYQGTGLGLYISKKIIEAHGGKMWAENNLDGIGSTFSFSLDGIAQLNPEL